MPRWLTTTHEWLQASDPGWSRLRLAASGASAMATALAVELGFAHLIDAGPKNRLIAMVLGGVIAMLGSMALNAAGGNAWTKTRTAAIFPLAIGVGMALGVPVGKRTDLMLTVFVVVMFVAVFVRRFGVAYFFYGFMFWLGYFFASFLQAKLSMLPFLVGAAVLGSAWVLALALSVFRVNPTRTLQRTIAAFDARARGLTRACAELLQSPDPADSRIKRRLRRRIHGQERRLAEAALMVEGWAAEPAALPAGQSAAALRRQLIEAQQALDALVTTTETLAQTGDQHAAAAGRIARRLAWRDDAAARHQAERLKERCQTHSRTGPPGADAASPRRSAAYRFARATLVFTTLADSARRLKMNNELLGDSESDAFEPTAGLIMGNLPGSPSVARGLSARGAGWNPLARLDLTSRQAIQVAIAGALAILAGRALSPTRYYWAVIAAFIMFSGTATRSETFLKGFNRVLGTGLGLAAAVGLAELTAGHSWAIVTTIVVSMFCGFYLIRVGYAYMIFFITIMVGQLYVVFREFTPGLLVLRLEETAIGAGVGLLVALVLMPLSTRDTVRSARRSLLQCLGNLLAAVAQRLGNEDPVKPASDAPPGDHASGQRSDLYALSRSLDDQVRSIALVTKPLTQPLLGGGNFVTARHRLNHFAATATSARALIVALQDMESTGPPAAFGDAARALAQAAMQLAETRPAQAGSAVAEPLGQADAALQRFDPASMSGHASEHLAQSLHRLLYLLRALSSTP